MTPLVLQYAEEVARRHHTTAEEVLNRSRSNAACAGRRALWMRLRDLGWSLDHIGRETAYDHSTVSYGLSKLRKAPKRAPKQPRRGDAPPTTDEVAREKVLAAAAAMLAKHQRELAQRY